MHTEYSEVVNELKYHVRKGLCYVWPRRSGEEAEGGETDTMRVGGVPGYSPLRTPASLY